MVHLSIEGLLVHFSVLCEIFLICRDSEGIQKAGDEGWRKKRERYVRW